MCLAPQNDRLNFSFVEDIHVVCEKMAINAECFKVGYFMIMIGNGHLAVANFGHQAVHTTYLFYLCIGEFIRSDNNRKALLLQIHIILSLVKDFFLQIIK